MDILDPYSGMEATNSIRQQAAVLHELYVEYVDGEQTASFSTLEALLDNLDTLMLEVDRERTNIRTTQCKLWIGVLIGVWRMLKEVVEYVELKSEFWKLDTPIDSSSDMKERRKSILTEIEQIWIAAIDILESLKKQYISLAESDAARWDEMFIGVAQKKSFRSSKQAKQLGAHLQVHSNQLMPSRSTLAPLSSMHADRSSSEQIPPALKEYFTNDSEPRRSRLCSEFPHVGCIFCGSRMQLSVETMEYHLCGEEKNYICTKVPETVRQDVTLLRSERLGTAIVAKEAVRNEDSFTNAFLASAATSRFRRRSRRKGKRPRVEEEKLRDFRDEKADVSARIPTEDCSLSKEGRNSLKIEEHVISLVDEDGEASMEESCEQELLKSHESKIKRLITAAELEMDRLAMPSNLEKDRSSAEPSKLFSTKLPNANVQQFFFSYYLPQVARVLGRESADFDANYIGGTSGGDWGPTIFHESFKEHGAIVYGKMRNGRYNPPHMLDGDSTVEFEIIAEDAELLGEGNLELLIRPENLSLGGLTLALLLLDGTANPKPAMEWLASQVKEGNCLTEKLSKVDRGRHGVVIVSLPLMSRCGLIDETMLEHINEIGYFAEVSGLGSRLYIPKVKHGERRRKSLPALQLEQSHPRKKRLRVFNSQSETEDSHQFCPTEKYKIHLIVKPKKYEVLNAQGGIKASILEISAGIGRGRTCEHDEASRKYGSIPLMSLKHLKGIIIRSNGEPLDLPTKVKRMVDFLRQNGLYHTAENDAFYHSIYRNDLTIQGVQATLRKNATVILSGSGDAGVEVRAAAEGQKRYIRAASNEDGHFSVLEAVLVEDGPQSKRRCKIVGRVQWQPDHDKLEPVQGVVELMGSRC